MNALLTTHINRIDGISSVLRSEVSLVVGWAGVAGQFTIKDIGDTVVTKYGGAYWDEDKIRFSGALATAKIISVMPKYDTAEKMPYFPVLNKRISSCNSKWRRKEGY